MRNLTRIIFLSAIFVAGWTSVFLLPENTRRIWLILPYVLAMVTAIEGSWKVLPIMALGLCVAGAMIWGSLSVGERFYMDDSDWFFFIGIALNLSAILGAAWLIRSENRRSAVDRERRRLIVSTLCVTGAMFLGGGIVRAYSMFSMDRLPPEIVGLLSVTVVISVIWTVVRMIRIAPPTAERLRNNDTLPPSFF